MANVLDAIASVLNRQGPMSTWKLQKPVHCCQAWSLVWNDDVLFPGRSRHGPTGRWCMNSTKRIAANSESPAFAGAARMS